MADNLWEIYDYEVKQLLAMHDLLCHDNPVLRVYSQELKNAVVESALIHTRILTGIFLSQAIEDDFTVKDLAPSFESPNVERLRVAFGTNADNGSPRSTINKRLAHASKIRSNTHDYTDMLMTLLPIIGELISELESHRQIRGNKTA